QSHVLLEATAHLAVAELPGDVGQLMPLLRLHIPTWNLDVDGMKAGLTLVHDVGLHPAQERRWRGLRLSVLVAITRAGLRDRLVFRHHVGRGIDWLFSPLFLELLLDSLSEGVHSDLADQDL